MRFYTSLGAPDRWDLRTIEFGLEFGDDAGANGF